jgi:Ca2+-binding EF-hand superfamily protein
MCLEKQLAQHSKYLFNFNQVFAEVDRDRDGQLSQDEFSELIKKMDIGVSGEQAQELYYQMQKSYAVGEGLVQYSQIIQVLSTEEAGLNGLRK